MPPPEASMEDNTDPEKTFPTKLGDPTTTKTSSSSSETHSSSYPTGPVRGSSKGRTFTLKKQDDKKPDDKKPDDKTPKNTSLFV